MQKTIGTKMKCNPLLKKISDRGPILDNESYFKLYQFAFYDNSIYYTIAVSTTKRIIKFATKVQFEGKILVWIAIIRKAWIIGSSEFVGSMSRVSDIWTNAWEVVSSVAITTAAIASYCKRNCCKIVFNHFCQLNVTFVEKSLTRIMLLKFNQCVGSEQSFNPRCI